MSTEHRIETHFLAAVLWFALFTRNINWIFFETKRKRIVKLEMSHLCIRSVCETITRNSLPANYLVNCWQNFNIEFIDCQWLIWGYVFVLWTDWCCRRRCRRCCSRKRFSVHLKCAFVPVQLLLMQQQKLIEINNFPFAWNECEKIFFIFYFLTDELWVAFCLRH